MIWEELSEDLIFEDLQATHTDHVFEQLGARMIETGHAKDTYIQALKEREAGFPTGLDLGEIGVAIPHTDISHVNDNAIAIARLHEPVTFIQMGSDDEPVDVDLIFMLAVRNPGGHIEHLSRIIEIIQDQNVLKAMKKAKDARAMIQVIRAKEEAIENPEEAPAFQPAFA